MQSYTVEFLFPTITLPEHGNYLAKFYILMVCELDKEGCEQAQDFITLSINDAENENSILLYKEYLLKDLKMQKKWIQYQVKFSVSSTKVQVMSLILFSISA